MKKIVLLLLLLSLASGLAEAVTDRPFNQLNPSAVLQQPGRQGFSFALFGDFRPSRRDKPYPDPYREILSETSMIGPSFIISLGDAYYGYGGPFQRFKNEIDYFLSTVKPLNVPFFNIIGNHEVADAGERARERGDYARSHFGSSYGSFDFGGSHFIFLDSDEKGKEGTISGGQLSWLEKDLKDNAKAKHILVFLHRPLFSDIDPDLSKGKSFKDRANRDYLHALFVRFKVGVVFAAHEHLYNETVKDGVRYIISGGGGAPLYSSPSEGGFFHYLLVRVTADDIHIDVLSPYTVRMRTIINNDALDPKAEIEVGNISHTDLDMRNIPVRMPRTSADKYTVKAVSVTTRDEIKNHKASINSIRDNGDGTSTLGIGTMLPKNGLLRITVEAGF